MVLLNPAGSLPICGPRERYGSLNSSDPVLSSARSQCTVPWSHRLTLRPRSSLTARFARNFRSTPHMWLAPIFGTLPAARLARMRRPPSRARLTAPGRYTPDTRFAASPPVHASIWARSLQSVHSCQPARSHARSGRSPRLALSVRPPSPRVARTTSPAHFHTTARAFSTVHSPTMARSPR